MKIQLMLVALLFLVGCGTVKKLPYPYKQVAGALKEKFGTEYDAFATTKPQVTETPKTMEILFSVDVDFYFSITPMITIKKKGEKETEIVVKVTEYFKSWSYQSRSKKREKEFIETLETRLAKGEWKTLPWMKKENMETSVFSAMFQNIGE